MNDNQQKDILNNLDSTQPLNVIPTMEPQNSENQDDTHQFDDAFMQTLTNNNANNTNQNKFINNPIDNNQILETPSIDEMDELNKVIKTPQNRFINSDMDTANNNSLNDLNIESEYQEGPKIDYSKDPKVMENMNKKNTINIGSEGKIFLIIIIVLFIFVLGLPTVFDLLRKIQYQ